MINVESYLNDGANWQAQAVLAYVRANRCSALECTFEKRFADYGAEISVGRYENCREQGYVFMISLFSPEETKCKFWAVYEHRNSDELCVLINGGYYPINTPRSDEMWHGKTYPGGLDKSFRYGEIKECGDWILASMRKFLEENYKHREE